MYPTFIVMAGGAIGAAARYHCSLLAVAVAGPRWPWGTFAVNALGGLAIGLLVGFATARGISEGWRLFLAVGVLGGFTTFSAFGLEVWQRIEQGAWAGAAGYAAASLLVTVLLVGAGATLARAVLA